MENNNLESIVKTLTLGNLARQTAAYELTKEEKTPLYVGTVLEEFFSYYPEIIKQAFGDYFSLLKTKYIESVTNIQKEGEFVLDEVLRNYFNYRRELFSKQYNKEDLTLKELNEALKEAGAQVELTGNPDLTLKEIKEKAESETATEEDKVLAQKVAYAHSKLLDLSKSKLKIDVYNKQIAELNKASETKKEEPPLKNVA